MSHYSVLIQQTNKHDGDFSHLQNVSIEYDRRQSLVSAK